MDECISRALEYNLQVRQAGLSLEISQVNREQAAASRFPTLDASVRQNFAWSDKQNVTGGYEFEGSNGSTASLNSGLTLFSGFRKQNSVKQASLDYQRALLDAESIRQDIALQVLDNYLQVLYAGELVNNSRNQLTSTGRQLELAGERLNLRIISMADYLQVKAQESAEKLTLANAEKQLLLSRISLMQLLEIPVHDTFAIATPDLSGAGLRPITDDAGLIYEKALEIRPEVKSASLQKKMAGYETDLARGAMLPTLSLSAGLSTSYSSLAEGLKFASQLDHNFSPVAGLTLSMPIFQQKQVKSQISLARISARSAEINEQSTLNQLRKNIETAWATVVAAEKEFQASEEQHRAMTASYEVATERFNQGIISPVDYLFEKTNLINAESKLLQSRYNLIFSYKELEFYQGKPLTL
ncbi:TolC family protein [Lentimicrobium saccharophilum]|uniref:TolC family protein n=1 Tax=Lentimicrobium saccharophilum TaxID=1678841 RepID=UPI00155DB5E7|nr:TolC family protein [Lentimicrobium saccharophilum]